MFNIKLAFKLYADDIKLCTSFNNRHFNSIQLFFYSFITGLFFGNSRLINLNPAFTPWCRCYLSGVFHQQRLHDLIGLGIYTTSKLTYSRHISSISAKALTRYAIVHCSFYSYNISLIRLAFIYYICLSLFSNTPVRNPSTLKCKNELEHVRRPFAGPLSSL